jgi:hypothetical protein
MSWKSIVIAAAGVAGALAHAPAWAGPILLIEDQGGFGNASTVLTSNGFSVTVVNNEFANGRANLLNGAFLAGFDFVVYGERGDGSGAVMPAGVQASLEAYVQGGGHLLVTGHDTLGSPTDANLATLLRVTSPGDNISYQSGWNVANIDNPILNGPFGDFRGTSFAATGYDDDDFDAGVGTVVLVTMNDGDERLVFNDLAGVAGSVGYWNGGNSGSGNAQPDFSDGGSPQDIFLNWAAFATANGASQAPAVPEPATGAFRPRPARTDGAAAPAPGRTAL